MTPNFQNTLEDSLYRLFDYCQKNDWSGYDPYDALNSELFKRMPFLDSWFPRLALTQFLKRSPINFRKLLLIPKTQNPKALALFLKTFLKLEEIGILKDETLIPLMVQRIKELRSPVNSSNLHPVKFFEENSKANLTGASNSINTINPCWSWGYSFPWQGRSILAPKGAANLVCTVFVANALLDLYEENLFSSSEANLQPSASHAYAGEVVIQPQTSSGVDLSPSSKAYLQPSALRKACLDMASSAAEYILSLYWEDDNRDAGFSYPLPSLKTRVHNANFLAAALFCRIYKHTKEKKYLEPALKAARYSAGKQLPDGSWYYGEHEKQQWVDNFHTGYNLSALQIICDSMNTDEFKPHIRSGFDFYINNFFTADNLPKYFHNSLYPIDIHAVAHSIITLVEFRDYNDKSMELAIKICLWAIENMQNKEGYFYYQKKKYYTNKIPYMRWSQAWMLYALATLLQCHHPLR